LPTHSQPLENASTNMVNMNSMRFLNSSNYDESLQRKSTDVDNNEEANVDVESSGSQTDTQSINREKGNNLSSLDFFA
jgi:hypothetical protein